MCDVTVIENGALIKKRFCVMVKHQGKIKNIVSSLKSRKSYTNIDEWFYKFENCRQLGTSDYGRRKMNLQTHIPYSPY
jgi:hypothetical protein